MPNAQLPLLADRVLWPARQMQYVCMPVATAFGLGNLLTCFLQQPMTQLLGGTRGLDTEIHEGLLMNSTSQGAWEMPNCRAGCC